VQRSGKRQRRPGKQARWLPQIDASEPEYLQGSLATFMPFETPAQEVA
jgi:hypothetical protein